MLSYFSPKNAKIDGSGQVEPESLVHASPAGICDLGFYGQCWSKEPQIAAQAPLFCSSRPALYRSFLRFRPEFPTRCSLEGAAWGVAALYPYHVWAKCAAR